ncbi:unnamed protein product [Cyprideis torosa]|uniref:Uncharacterized protein n=1 Tax=Cyprideis torosa TaxID=163714 RepID=A0A7R8ZTE3_9CRUS|nr:unnamed protein product [Cyprideis torosa]CAG0898025.1 unnamed protein product [Cyprideis torosa]
MVSASGMLRQSCRLLVVRRQLLLLRTATTKAGLLRILATPPDTVLSNERQDSPPAPVDNPNDRLLSGFFNNRNPRNLELLRIARRPKGFTLDKGFRGWLYLVEFGKIARGFEARLIHNNGRTVIKVATSDPCFEGVKSFFEICAAQGIHFGEPLRIHKPFIYHPRYQTKPWEVTEEDVLAAKVVKSLWSSTDIADPSLLEELEKEAAEEAEGEAGSDDEGDSGKKGRRRRR